MTRLLKLVLVLACGSLFFAGQASATGSYGYLEICKETQGGLTGTFSFTFAGQTASINVTPGATQPVCTPSKQVTAGQVTVNELASSSTEICGIRTVQAGRLVWTLGRTASVMVPQGGPETETTLVYCNKPAPTGRLKICKVAGAGISPGTNYTFTVRNTSTGATSTVYVPAGYCVLDGSFPHSTTVEVTESVPAGVEVAARTVTPSGETRTCANPQANRVCAHISGGLITEVRFTNRKEEDKGWLKLCKAAGSSGISGHYTFTVKQLPAGPSWSVSVPVGYCVLVGDFPASTTLEITEWLPAGQAVSFDVDPAAESRTCPAPQSNRVCVHISKDTITKVVATNRVVAEKGRLKICKVAGAGVTPGTNYTFTVKNTATGATSTVVVPAGNCVLDGEFPHSTTVEVTETVPAGIEIAAKSVTPAGETRTCTSPQSNRVCAHISGGLITEVSFTNRKVDDKGWLKLCKYAGSDGISGVYTFWVKELPSGPTHTVYLSVGSCVVLGPFPHSTTLQITEAVPSGQAVSFDVDPDWETRTCPYAASNRVCAHISGGAITKVIATNRKVTTAKPALKVCKIAGAGVERGTDFLFHFKLLSTGQTFSVKIAAGFCIVVFGIPASTTVQVTEIVPDGYELVPPIAISPVDETRTCSDPAPNRACAHVSSGQTTEMRFTNRRIAY